MNVKTKFKCYQVQYSGNATRFKGFNEMVLAKTKREAVQRVYRVFCDSDYFPQTDGTINDADGNQVATSDDSVIYYDGGFFYAEIYEEFFIKTKRNEMRELKFYHVKFTDGNGSVMYDTTEIGYNERQALLINYKYVWDNDLDLRDLENRDMENIYDQNGKLILGTFDDFIKVEDGMITVENSSYNYELLQLPLSETEMDSITSIKRKIYEKATRY